MNGRSRNGGFNLIELLITLAVISIAFGVGVPMYGKFTRDSAISGASSELVASLNESRSRAVSERAAISVDAINEDWTQGWRSIRVGDPADDADDEVLLEVRRTDTETVTIREVSDMTSISFDREGRSAAGEFEIRVAEPQPGDSGRRIVLSPIGRVEIEKTVEP